MRLTKRAEEEIRFSAAPTQDWLKRLCDSGDFRCLGFLQSAAVCPPAEFHSVWRRGTARPPFGVTEQDMALLAQFGAALGTTDVAGQLELCREYGERLKEQREQASRQQREKSRLYTTLGLMSGLGVALLML